MPDHCLLMLYRYDPLRDGPLRYLGYANELGEAFAAWLFPGGVPLRWAALLGGRRRLQPHVVLWQDGGAAPAPPHMLNNQIALPSVRSLLQLRDRHWLRALRHV